MRQIMVSLCDESGVMAEPWAAAGYDCYCVDTAHSIRRDRREGRINFVWGDARSWCPPERTQVVFLAAFPPCTHVAGSGARDWIKKGHYLLTDALELFSACMSAGSWSGAPYCIENPVGALSRHMRQPDYTFHPNEYAGLADDPQAEAYTKRTCLWTGNGFRMPTPNAVEPVLGTLMHRLPPSENREAIRSRTPQGFARAVFQANAPAEIERTAA